MTPRKASWTSALTNGPVASLILPLYVLLSDVRTKSADGVAYLGAAVNENLAFGIMASTSFESPLLAKCFSTLDHLTDGQIGGNIVTSWKKAAFKAIRLDTPIEHDERYRQADEYLHVLHKEPT